MVLLLHSIYSNLIFLIFLSMYGVQFSFEIPISIRHGVFDFCQRNNFLLSMGLDTSSFQPYSGDGFSSKAGEDGLGTLAQGYLEGSNVKMVDEMVNLMVAQRIYEANVKVVQASDEMLGMIYLSKKCAIL